MDGRFAGFRVAKQGDADNACGLYCVLTAAQHVFRDNYDAHKAAVLRRIAIGPIAPPGPDRIHGDACDQVRDSTEMQRRGDHTGWCRRISPSRRLTR
jgi:hypothetical protein